MGNRNSQASRPSTTTTSPPAYNYQYPTSQGHHLYPQPNMGSYAYDAPQKIIWKPPGVMDCNEAAERYGGFVISEYYGGNYPRKSQGFAG